MAMPPDMRAHHITTLAGLVADTLRSVSLSANAAETMFSLLEQIRHDAETLCEDLDPCNAAGSVAPLYADILAAAVPGALGENVIPFRPRQ